MERVVGTGVVVAWERVLGVGVIRKDMISRRIFGYFLSI